MNEGRIICAEAGVLSWRFRMFMCRISLLWVLVWFSLPGSGLAAEIPAFPGAEGFGSTTPGGRGGQVLLVASLDDYVPGKEKPISNSLRAAVSAKGPRIVVFRVS